MALYAIRNRSVNNFVDNFLGLNIPAKAGVNEGVLVVDTNDASTILRAGSDLYTFFTTGTVNNGGNPFTYGDPNPDLYVSTIITDGENVADIVTGVNGLGADALRADYAYKALLNNTATNVSYNGTGTNFLDGTVNVQSALTSLDTQIATLSGVSDTITWRPNVFAITTDPQFNAPGPIVHATITVPFTDDDAPNNFALADITDGSYILYKGAAAADDKLWKRVGANLVLQTGTNGVQNDGYAYIVKNDLIDTPAVDENQSLWVFVAGSGLTKLSDIDWGDISLQEAYNGGNAIVLANDTPFTLSDGTNPIFRASTDTAGNNWVAIDGLGTGQVNITGQAAVNITGQSVNLDDANLAAPIGLSQTGITGFNATEWDKENNGGTTGNGVFDWSRTATSIDTPTSIMGAIEATREDLNEYVTLINTPPVQTDVDANGANIVGVKGIVGITPTAGTAGAAGSLQAVLEEMSTKINSVAGAAGGKSYADIAAFTTAKAGGAIFQLNEVVFIADINRFVEVLSTNTNISENTDWDYVGGNNDTIQGPGLYYNLNGEFSLNVNTGNVNIGAVGANAQLNLYTAGDQSISSGTATYVVSPIVSLGTAAGTTLVTGTNALFTDARAGAAKHGLEYAADYSATYVDRSLVDKAYVDSKTAASGGKTYANITAFTTAKAVVGAAPFVLGETVYIQDINRFVEVLTTNDNIVQGTDWAYVGDLANAIGGTDYVVSATNVVLGNGSNGTVKIADGAYLVLPSSSAPGTYTPVAGATAYDATEGKIYVYDSSRLKWISADRQLLQFGASSSDGQYLSINGVTSGLTGFLMPRNAVITAITIKATGNLTKAFEVRANGTQIGVAKTLAAGVYSAINEDINVNAGDFVQIFSRSAGERAQNVVAVIELAYRK